MPALLQSPAAANPACPFEQAPTRIFFPPQAPPCSINQPVPAMNYVWPPPLGVAVYRNKTTFVNSILMLLTNTNIQML